jgi:hydrogenase nickel incorporation protein HypA/HybF
MHEYGLMEDVVNVALEACRRAGDPVVARVRVEVGEFAVASRESLKTAFEVLTRGTPLEGTRLEISEVSGRAVCDACDFAGSAADLGTELSEPPNLVLCPRCGMPLRVTAGGGISVIDVQLKDRGRLDPRDADHGGR